MKQYILNKAGKSAILFITFLILAILFFLGLHQEAFATGENLPWEAPLERLVKSFEGPVVRGVAILVICFAGIKLATGDTSGGMKTLLNIIIGLAVMASAASFFVSDFFGFSGGALI